MVVVAGCQGRAFGAAHPLSAATASLNFQSRNISSVEAIRRGNYPGYHMLNKCEIEGFHDDFLVVDFRSTFSVPLDFLKGFVKDMSPRLRLLPPYREHLSQAFARFLMRVGLPEDIPAFT